MIRVVDQGRTAVVSSPQGVARFVLRPGTVDEAAVRESWVEDVYGIDRTDWTGIATELRDGAGAVVERRNVRPVMIDVGAHIGAVTVRAVYAGAHVIAFEPDMVNVSRLVEHVDELCDGHAEVMPYAVADLDGTAYVSPIGDTGMVEVTPAGGTPVEAWSLDRAVAYALTQTRNARVRLLKIDVEGYEYSIVAGATGSLAQCDMVMIETHPTDPATVGRLAAKLADTHSVQIVGPAEVGGYIAARRYGF